MQRKDTRCRGNGKRPLSFTGELIIDKGIKCTAYGILAKENGLISVGEMALWLRALPLPEDLGSSPSSHLVYNHL